ncbi:hypothetical protein HDZ31DRAFT_65686 [Schizophyllum fasciatum]
MKAERDASLTPPPALPHRPSAMGARRIRDASPDSKLIFDAEQNGDGTVADINSRPRIKHCVEGMTRRGPEGSNLDPPACAFDAQGGVEGFDRKNMHWAGGLAREEYSRESGAVDAEVAQHYFPAHVWTSARPAPPESIFAIMHKATKDLPVLEKVNQRVHERVVNGPQMLSLRDIPWTMSELDVDSITGEVFDISGRLIEGSQVAAYHLVLKDHEKTLEVADYLIACGEAVKYLVRARRGLAKEARDA